MTGVVAWIYLRANEAAELRERNESLSMRSYFVTGKIAILPNGCARGQSQLAYYKTCSALIQSKITTTPRQTPRQTRLSPGNQNRYLFFTLILGVFIDPDAERRQY